MSDEVRIPLRWTDFDPAGHVTDTAYPAFLSEARGVYIRERLGSYIDWPCVVRSVSVDYHNEIPYPALYVVVSTRVAEIGRSSVRFEHDVRTADGALAATSTATLVAFDPVARTAREIPSDDRQRLRPAGGG